MKVKQATPEQVVAFLTGERAMSQENEIGCTGTTGLCCSGAVGAETIMSGPCVICGLSNYPLSMGGPTICPSCDCGDFGLTKIVRQRKEIERLTRDLEIWKRNGGDILQRAEIERLTAKIAYVRQRSQRACEILNEFDNTRPKP